MYLLGLAPIADYMHVIIHKGIKDKHVAYKCWSSGRASAAIRAKIKLLSVHDISCGITIETAFIQKNTVLALSGIEFLSKGPGYPVPEFLLSGFEQVG
jgi:hypothetical protein